MTEEILVDDYIFERTLTHLKLISESKMEEVKLRQAELKQQKNIDKHLWEIVVDMHYLTKETVDEVLESYIHKEYAKVSAADKKTKNESVRLNIAEVRLDGTNSHKADVLYIKTCIANNLITADVGKVALENLPKDGPLRSWRYVSEKGILSEKIALKVLKKLVKKFPIKFEGLVLPQLPD